MQRSSVLVQVNLDYSVPVFTMRGLGGALGFLDSSFTTFLSGDRTYYDSAGSYSRCVGVRR